MSAAARVVVRAARSSNDTFESARTGDVLVYPAEPDTSLTLARGALSVAASPDPAVAVEGDLAALDRVRLDGSSISFQSAAAVLNVGSFAGASGSQDRPALFADESSVVLSISRPLEIASLEAKDTHTTIDADEVRVEGDGSLLRLSQLGIQLIARNGDVISPDDLSVSAGDSVVHLGGRLSLAGVMEVTGVAPGGARVLAGTKTRVTGDASVAHGTLFVQAGSSFGAQSLLVPPPSASNQAQVLCRQADLTARASTLNVKSALQAEGQVLVDSGGVTCAPGVRVALRSGAEITGTLRAVTSRPSDDVLRVVSARDGLRQTLMRASESVGVVVSADVCTERGIRVDQISSAMSVWAGTRDGAPAWTWQAAPDGSPIQPAFVHAPLHTHAADALRITDGGGIRVDGAGALSIEAKTASPLLTVSARQVWCSALDVSGDLELSGSVGVDGVWQLAASGWRSRAPITAFHGAPLALDIAGAHPAQLLGGGGAIGPLLDVASATVGGSLTAITDFALGSDADVAADVNVGSELSIGDDFSVSSIDLAAQLNVHAEFESNISVRDGATAVHGAPFTAAHGALRVSPSNPSVSVSVDAHVLSCSGFRSLLTGANATAAEIRMGPHTALRVRDDRNTHTGGPTAPATLTVDARARTFESSSSNVTALQSVNIAGCNFDVGRLTVAEVRASAVDAVAVGLQNEATFSAANAAMRVKSQNLHFALPVAFSKDVVVDGHASSLSASQSALSSASGAVFGGNLSVTAGGASCQRVVIDDPAAASTGSNACFTVSDEGGLQVRDLSVLSECRISGAARFLGTAFEARGVRCADGGLSLSVLGGPPSVTVPPSSDSNAFVDVRASNFLVRDDAVGTAGLAVGGDLEVGTAEAASALHVTGALTATDAEVTVLAPFDASHVGSSVRGDAVVMNGSVICRGARASVAGELVVHDTSADSDIALRANDVRIQVGVDARANGGMSAYGCVAGGHLLVRGDTQVGAELCVRRDGVSVLRASGAEGVHVAGGGGARLAADVSVIAGLHSRGSLTVSGNARAFGKWSTGRTLHATTGTLSAGSVLAEGGLTVGGALRLPGSGASLERSAFRASRDLLAGCNLALNGSSLDVAGRARCGRDARFAGGAEITSGNAAVGRDLSVSGSFSAASLFHAAGLRTTSGAVYRNGLRVSPDARHVALAVSECNAGATSVVVPVHVLSPLRVDGDADVLGKVLPTGDVTIEHGLRVAGDALVDGFVAIGEFSAAAATKIVAGVSNLQAVCGPPGASLSVDGRGALAASGELRTSGRLRLASPALSVGHGGLISPAGFAVAFGGDVEVASAVIVGGGSSAAQQEHVTVRDGGARFDAGLSVGRELDLGTKSPLVVRGTLEAAAGALRASVTCNLTEMRLPTTIQGSLVLSGAASDLTAPTASASNVIGGNLTVSSAGSGSGSGISAEAQVDGDARFEADFAAGAALALGSSNASGGAQARSLTARLPVDVANGFADLFVVGVGGSDLAATIDVLSPSHGEAQSFLVACSRPALGAAAWQRCLPFVSSASDTPAVELYVLSSADGLTKFRARYAGAAAAAGTPPVVIGVCVTMTCASVASASTVVPLGASGEWSELRTPAPLHPSSRLSQAASSVGVGLDGANATRVLDVAGDLYSTDEWLAGSGFAFSSSLDTGFFQPRSRAMEVQVAGIRTLALLPSSSVAIGPNDLASSSLPALSVAGNAAASIRVLAGADGSAFAPGICFEADNRRLGLYRAANGLGVATSGRERMALAHAASPPGAEWRVGLGTSAPAANGLAVAGDVRVAGDMYVSDAADASALSCASARIKGNLAVGSNVAATTLTALNGLNGDGSTLTSLDAAAISTGVMALSRLPAADHSNSGVVRLSSAIDSSNAGVAANAAAVKALGSDLTQYIDANGARAQGAAYPIGALYVYDATQAPAPPPGLLQRFPAGSAPLPPGGWVYRGGTAFALAQKVD